MKEALQTATSRPAGTTTESAADRMSRPRLPDRAMLAKQFRDSGGVVNASLIQR